MVFSIKVSVNEVCIDGMVVDFLCSNIDLFFNVFVNVLLLVLNSINDIWGYVDLNNCREYVIVGM